MAKITTIKLLASLTGLISLNVFAANSYFEARNDAMGGAGVASSHYGVAPLSNPALLTKYSESDDVSILLPSIGVELAYNNDIASNYQGILDDISDSENGGNSEEEMKRRAASLRNALEKLEGTSIDAQLGLSTVIAIPNDTLSFAFMMKSYGIANIKVNIDPDDITNLKKIENGKSENDEDIDNIAIKSNISGSVAAISEIGVALAKKFQTYGKQWSLGITPKFQRVDLFKISKSIRDKDENANNSNTSEYNSQNGVNADIGAYMDLFDYWTVGLAVQNIIPRSIDTGKVNGDSDTLKIRPQATAGVSWKYSLFNVALDVDLTPASGFASDNMRQFASVGGEVDIYKWAQLRAGYRQNMREGSGSAVTAGLGLSPFDVLHLDVAAMYGLDNSYGVVTQLKITF